MNDLKKVHQYNPHSLDCKKDSANTIKIVWIEKKESAYIALERLMASFNYHN